MRLADFCTSEQATQARLDEAHVAACRLYTTAAFRFINDPLRDQDRSEPHPLAVTVSFLTAAIGKLRVLGANQSDARSALDLWRGLKDVTVPDSFSRFGGTELAPMSCTTDLSVALQYCKAANSRSQTALIFKCRTDSFMSRGASIEFLSVFPGESEVLFPPLSYLNPTGKQKTVYLSGQQQVCVVEVVPHFGSA